MQNAQTSVVHHPHTNLFLVAPSCLFYFSMFAFSPTPQNTQKIYMNVWRLVINATARMQAPHTNTEHAHFAGNPRQFVHRRNIFHSHITINVTKRVQNPRG